MKPELGSVVGGKYRLERALAAGGMGSVWVARDLRLEIQVAVKFMAEAIAAAPTAANRFEREAKAAAQEMVRNNPGYDIVSTRGDDPSVFLEVKGRLAGAEDFFVTHTEIRHGQNAAPHYRLALVRVDPLS